MISELRTLVKYYGWLLLSHHPKCNSFVGYTLLIKVPVCRGCVLGYPTAGVTFLLVFKLLPQYSPLAYLVIAVAAAGFASIGLFIKHSKPLFETLRGVALGFGLMALVQSHSVWEGLVVGILLSSAAILYLGLRFVRMSAICRACSHHEEMPYCPGLTAAQSRYDS